MWQLRENSFRLENCVPPHEPSYVVASRAERRFHGGLVLWRSKRGRAMDWRGMVSI